MSENPTTAKLPRVGITHGDINGISYEIILKAFGDSRMLSMMTPILYGQSKALSYYKKNFGMDDFNYSLTRDVRQSWNQKFNILNIIDQELKIEPGMATEVSAEMALLSLKKAVEDLNDGYTDALVMAPACRPVEKSNVEYLLSFHKDSEVVQIMVNSLMRLGLVTGDIPLDEALAQLSVKQIVRKLQTLAKALKSDFNITSPKIAVLGLDAISAEKSAQNDLVSTAVTEARNTGIFAFGPFPSLKLFGTGLWQKYDAVLALYYEQACLPMQLISTSGCASYWAGLPVVCTAPLQGPEFDIANANQAEPDAFRAALYLALDVIANRKDK